MSPFEFTVLGSNAAVPTSDRNPSAHVVNLHERFFLLDCGEGTQMQLRKYGFRLGKIEMMFISHLHGDHIFGLPGLVNTLHLLGREKELVVFAPEGLQEIISVINKHTDTHFQFPLRIETIDTRRNDVIYEDDAVEIRSIPMSHRIPCCGFRVDERVKLFNIRKDAVERYKLSPAEIWLIKNGADHRMPDGRIIPNSELVHDKQKSRSLAYCSDTKASGNYNEFIRDADLLYHEATFADELKEKAKQTFHSTARQAAEVAKAVNAGQLIIGHFSARYPDAGILLNQARSVFPETQLAEEGKTFPVQRPVQKIETN